MVQLEGQAQAAQQKAMQADAGARRRAGLARQGATPSSRRLARRLNESEKTLTATQNRLKAAETGLAEAQADRTRLAAALDEANHKHLDEMNVQNSPLRRAAGPRQSDREPARRGTPDADGARR